jgi:hypothetical protein
MSVKIVERQVAVASQTWEGHLGCYLADQWAGDQLGVGAEPRGEGNRRYRRSQDRGGAAAGR